MALRHVSTVITCVVRSFPARFSRIKETIVQVPYLISPRHRQETQSTNSRRISATPGWSTYIRALIRGKMAKGAPLLSLTSALSVPRFTRRR